MQRRRRVTVLPGVGLVGDRYATSNGYWSGDFNVSRDLTVVEAEVVERVAADNDIPIRPDELRRNVVVRGVRLNELVGVRFRIGEVVVEGTGLCEPCVQLARVTGKPIVRPFVHRGGLRANILSCGDIVEGDVVALDAPAVGVAVVVRRDGQYLLGLRGSPRGNGMWSTPGGMVQPGESVLACAARELMEQTGLIGQLPRVIGRSIDLVNDEVWCSVFVAVDVQLESQPEALEPAKCVAWDWFDPSDLPGPLFPSIRGLFGGHYERMQ
jgi:ADP-ribose pyrophosphatase YjhB (NUDIX family)